MPSLVSTTTADDLPNEIWTEILGHVPIGEHAAIRLVSTRLCALSQSPALWQPVIQAALTRPVDPKSHRYDAVHQSIRQATRALEAMPPGAHGQTHLAATSARQSAIAYIDAGLCDQDARYQPMRDRFAHGVLPHLPQAALRTLWLNTYRAILNAVSVMTNRDWTSTPSPLFARAVLLRAERTEAAAWFATIAQGVALVPPARGRQARFLLHAACDHIMAIAPSEAMPAMLQAAIDMHRNTPSPAAFDACYIDACIARMESADVEAAQLTLQTLVEANHVREMHARIELCAALFRRAAPQHASALAQILWHHIHDPACELERLRERVLPVLIALTPLAKLEAVWRLALSMPDTQDPGALGASVLFQRLAQRYHAPCDDSIVDLVLHPDSHKFDMTHRAAHQALGALAQHAFDEAQRCRSFELVYQRLDALLARASTTTPALTEEAHRISDLSTLLDTLVALTLYPAPHIHDSTRLFRMTWQHVHAGGSNAEICVKTMQAIAAHIAPSFHETVFEEARLTLSSWPPNVSEPTLRALLSAFECTLPHLGDMQHAHAIVVLHSVLARHPVVLGALAAQVLVQVRHGKAECQKSVQCIEARRQLAWRRYALTLPELWAADTLQRCTDVLRGKQPPPSSPIRTARLPSPSPMRKLASVWRHETRTCHDILAELTSPLADEH